MTFLAGIPRWWRRRAGSGAQRRAGAEIATGDGASGGGRAPEIHLFVLWDRARPWTDRIVRDISSHFRVLDGVELRWNSRLAARHYTRLYGQSLPPESDKVRECGAGFPLLLVVSDDMPHYGERRKWGRTYTVNVRLFDAKARYRQWVGGSSVHGTTDVRETEHDLFLLLGLRAADYAGRQGAWAGTFRPVRRDLTGSGGWRSRDELFTAIDLTVGYVALPTVDDGPTIRLLLDGRWPHWGLEWLIAEPERHPEGATTRVYPVVLGSQPIAVKLHHVGDGHHDADWQRTMVRDRVRGADTYVLAPDDAYLELLHELVRRGRATAADTRRVAELAEAAGYPVPDFTRPDAVASELRRHLARHGYAVARPSATSARFGWRTLALARRGWA